MGISGGTSWLRIAVWAILALAIQSASLFADESVPDFRLLSNNHFGYVPNSLFALKGEQDGTLVLQAYKQATGLEIPNAFVTVTRAEWESLFYQDHQRIQWDAEKKMVRFKKANGAIVFCKPPSPIERALAAAEEAAQLKSTTEPTSPSSEIRNVKIVPATPQELEAKAQDVAKLNAAFQWFRETVEASITPQSRAILEFGLESQWPSESLGHISPREYHRRRLHLFKTDPEGYKKIFGNIPPKYKQTFSEEAIVDVQTSTMSKVLQEIQKDPIFKNDDRLASQFLSALSLSGEFGAKTKDFNHRTLAHLYWSYQTARNRAATYPNRKTKGIGAIYFRIDPTYLPLVNTPTGAQWLEGTPGGVMLAANQYSTMNPGEGSMSRLLLNRDANADRNLFPDIFDVVAAMDRNLIVTEPKEAPFFTHYFSQRQRIFREPKYWRTEPGKPKLFEAYRNAADFPPVLRRDSSKQSVASAAEGISEFWVNTDHFIGGVELRWRP